ncbi:ribosomal protein L36e [Gautieria morchelliformis]|nr:ribosomal protein L36e [Gautieria morchelliformis]
MVRSNLRVGLNKGHPTTPIERAVKPSHRKGRITPKTSFTRQVIRDVAGYAPYERRVMELLRNSKLGTLLRAKRKIDELGAAIQESRRAGH